MIFIKKLAHYPKHKTNSFNYFYLKNAYSGIKYIYTVVQSTPPSFFRILSSLTAHEGQIQSFPDGPRNNTVECAQQNNKLGQCGGIHLYFNKKSLPEDQINKQAHWLAL